MSATLSRCKPSCPSGDDGITVIVAPSCWHDHPRRHSSPQISALAEHSTMTAGLSLPTDPRPRRKSSVQQAQNNRDRPPGPPGRHELGIPSSPLGSLATPLRSQTFLTQSVFPAGRRVSSFYDLGLTWQLSGTTLSQPGLAKAHCARPMPTSPAEECARHRIKQQYLTVLSRAQRTSRRNAAAQRGILETRQARYRRGSSDVIERAQSRRSHAPGRVRPARAQTP